MKQGIKNVQELYKELEEQRENRKDIIADTRSLMVSSTENKSLLYVSVRSRIGLVSPSSITCGCVQTTRNSWIRTSTGGWTQTRRNVCSVP